MRVCPVRNVFRPTKEGIPVRYRTDSVPGVELLGYGMAELYGEFEAKTTYRSSHNCHQSTSSRQ